MSGAPQQLRLTLTGADIHLDCLLDGDDIELDVHLRGQRRQVRSDQVRRHKTEIGTLATVDIRVEPRRPWIGLSVMLPPHILEWHLADGPQPVRTFAVETTGEVVEPPPMDSPVPLVSESGGLEPYRTIELAGTVRRVTAGVLNCQQWSAVRTIGYDGPDEITVKAGLKGWLHHLRTDRLVGGGGGGCGPGDCPQQNRTRSGRGGGEVSRCG